MKKQLNGRLILIPIIGFIVFVIAILFISYKNYIQFHWIKAVGICNANVYGLRFRGQEIFSYVSPCKPGNFI
ncbi:MAG: hypothetical protein Q8P91_00840 [bacterium]|nr:hypothetical protein [bacterium]